MRDTSRRRFLEGAPVLGIGAISGCISLGPSPEEQIAEHRESLARYRDVSRALADGYRTTAEYVRGSQGVLGTPFVNDAVDELRPEKPQVLLYDLTEEGAYEFVGVKWFRPTAEADSAPSLFGKTLAGPQDGEVPAIPEHYGLTAWLFRDNPEGLFSRYNPAIEPVPLVSTISSLRKSLREYRTGRSATEDGYRNTEKCIETERGFYGVPFVDETAVGSGGTDPSRPPILLYRLTNNWSYQLIGAEWLVPVDETDSPPALFGFDFHEPMDPHSPKTENSEHYGLHAWLFSANPRGMFSRFNPALVC